MAGFKISGKDNTEVLLAGGGSKALSDFAMSTALSGYLPLAGGTMTGKITFNQTSTARDVGIIGTYDPLKAAAIWSMGSSYLIKNDGTTLGSLYGAAYVYFGNGYTFGAGHSGGHSFVWALGGTIHAALGNYIWSRGGFIKNSSSDSYVLLGGGGHKAVSDFATATALSGYLPLSGGTLNNNAVISRTGTSVAWINGRKNPIIKTTSYTGYNAILSMKTTNGSWDLGVYSNDVAYFSYITDTDYSASHNATTYLLVFPKKNGTIATTSDIPTKTSQLTNDSGFLTSHQSLANYLPLSGGTMKSNAYIGFDNDATAFRMQIGADTSTSPLRGITTPTVGGRWIGIFARPGKSTDEGGFLLSQEGAAIYNSFDSGFGFKVVDTDANLNDWNSADSVVFSVKNDNTVYSKGGFVKKDSSNSYVLLGGGGHKAVSDFATATALSGYLPLTGGTLTGNENVLSIKRNHDTYGAYIRFINNTLNLGWIGFNSENVPIIRFTDWSTGYNIIHAGNIGSYAITLVADRLYSSLVSANQADLTWIKGIATTNGTNRSFIYNYNGTEWSYLSGFRNDGAYGAILKMGYSDRYLRILRKDSSGWKSTDWETIYSGYSDYSGKVYGSYSGNGGKQGPSYFGRNYAGFLMSNESINGYTNYTNWLYMDNYAGNDVGGATAIGVARTAARAFIMLSDANRTSWNNVAEIITTANISSYISDTNTWKPANTSQEGYVPKLAINNTAMTNSSTDLVLTYKYNTSETTPVWRKLPDSAFQSPNDGTITFYSLHSGLNSGNAYSVGTFSANLSGNSSLTLKAGNNITLTGDATNHIITITSSYSNDNTTSALYVGGSGNITSNSAQSSNGNVYLSLRESSGTYYSHKITGSGGTTVTSDSSGNITINSTSSASYNVVSSSDNGLAPKVTTTNSNVSVGTGYYFLAASSSTSTPAWYKLPTNAFYNDNSWRPVLINGTSIDNNTLNIKSGGGISVGKSNGTATISLYISVNGSTAGDSTSIYAPTSAGTSGYILQSNGSGAPGWTSFTSISSIVKIQSSVPSSFNSNTLYVITG